MHLCFSLMAFVWWRTFQQQSWLNNLSLLVLYLCSQMWKPSNCHREKGTESKTFPLVIWDLQNVAHRLLATNKKALAIKLRQSLPHDKKHVASNTGNVRVWIIPRISGEEGEERQMIYKESFPDQQHNKQQRGEGKEMHTAPSAGLHTPPCWYPQALKGKSLSPLCQMSSPDLNQGIQG